MQSEKELESPALHEDLKTSEDDFRNDGDVKRVEEHLEVEKDAPAGHVAETAEEKAMNRRINLKMDVAMLPLLSLCYLFSGLDRGNIGNAETQSIHTPAQIPINRTELTIYREDFTEDIGAKPEDLNFAVSIFFLTFVLFQPPSAALGRWIGPKHWIPIMMVILMSLTW